MTAENESVEEVLIGLHGKVIEHYRLLLTRGGLSVAEVQRVERGFNRSQAELDRILSTALTDHREDAAGQGLPHVSDEAR